MYVIHHHHHHHHLFLKRPFLPLSAKVRRFSPYEASPHIPEHYPFRVQTQLIHIILHIFSPSLPASTCTSHPCHHHIPTGQHPIISTLTLHMPKPPQSTMPHRLPQPCFEPQKTVQIHTARSAFLSFSDTPNIHLIELCYDECTVKTCLMQMVSYKIIPLTVTTVKPNYKSILDGLSDGCKMLHRSVNQVIPTQ